MPTSAGFDIRNSGSKAVDHMEIHIGQELFGRYTVAKKLGEGYFGRVYLAQDKTSTCRGASQLRN